MLKNSGNNGNWLSNPHPCNVEVTFKDMHRHVLNEDNMSYLAIHWNGCTTPSPHAHVLIRLTESDENEAARKLRHSR